MGLVFSDAFFFGAPGPFFLVFCDVLSMIISCRLMGFLILFSVFNFFA